MYFNETQVIILIQGNACGLQEPRMCKNCGSDFWWPFWLCTQ